MTCYDLSGNENFINTTDRKKIYMNTSLLNIKTDNQFLTTFNVQFTQIFKL